MGNQVDKKESFILEIPEVFMTKNSYFSIPWTWHYDLHMKEILQRFSSGSGSNSGFFPLTFNLLFPYSWLLFQCVYFTFHCPFISWWEFRLFLLWLEKQWTRLSVHLYFKSFEHLPRSIAESYGRYNFSLLRILNTDFRNGCMILQFHWHWASICVHVSLYRVI